MTQNDSLLLLGVESQRVTAGLLEPIGDDYRLAAWHDTAAAPPAAGPMRVAERIQQACTTLGSEVGRVLWAEGRPILRSPEPHRRPPLGQVVSLTTHLPYLRVFTLGLSGAGLAATAQAIAASPAQAVAAYRLDTGADPDWLAAELESAQPEAMVILGGHDQTEASAQRPLLSLCALVGDALARMPPGRRPVQIFAGNRWAAQKAQKLLRQAGGPVRVTTVANVQPRSDQVHAAPLAQALLSLYSDLSQRDALFQQLAGWAAPSVPTESLHWGFARLIHLWMNLMELPRLHGLYCGQIWWLHAWTEQGWTEQLQARATGAASPRLGVRFLFTEPHTQPTLLAGWPELQLVCGAWPEQIWPKAARHWQDGSCLAPQVAALQRLDPQMAVRLLVRDLLSQDR